MGENVTTPRHQTREYEFRETRKKMAKDTVYLKWKIVMRTAKPYRGRYQTDVVTYIGPTLEIVSVWFRFDLIFLHGATLGRHILRYWGDMNLSFGRYIELTSVQCFVHTKVTSVWYGNVVGLMYDCSIWEVSLSAGADFAKCLFWLRNRFNMG